MSEAEGDFEDSDKSDVSDEPQSSNRNQRTLNVYQCKELIHDHLISSGQRDLLKRMIQNRLAQTGFTYTLRMEFISYIKSRGRDKVNVSHMIEDLQPYGRAMLPDEVKVELRTFLRDFAKTLMTFDKSAPRPTEDEIANSSAGLTFRYQDRDVVPDPGIGVGVESSDCSVSSSGSNSSLADHMSSPDSGSSTPLADLPSLSPEAQKLLDSKLLESSSDGDNDMVEDAQSDAEDDDLEYKRAPSHKYGNLYRVQRGKGQTVDSDSDDGKMMGKGAKQKSDGKKKRFEEDDDSSSTHTYVTTIDDDEEELVDL